MWHVTQLLISVISVRFWKHSWLKLSVQRLVWTNYKYRAKIHKIRRKTLNIVVSILLLITFSTHATNYDNAYDTIGLRSCWYRIILLQSNPLHSLLRGKVFICAYIFYMYAIMVVIKKENMYISITIDTIIVHVRFDDCCNFSIIKIYQNE